MSNFLSFKCKYMIIMRKQSPGSQPCPLNIFNTPMQRVDCYNYLGLLITNNLTWSAHIHSICSKAKKILGLIYRRFYTSANQETLKQLYISLVRPHVEYACQVWDPYLDKDKKLLEDVQKFGCKIASHQWDSSYQDLLQLLELQTLEERRLHLKLGVLFKIIHSFHDIPTFCSTIPGLRAPHQFQFVPPFAHTIPHTMSVRNSLSRECVSSASYPSFITYFVINFLGAHKISVTTIALH